MFEDYLQTVIVGNSLCISIVNMLYIFCLTVLLHIKENFSFG